MQKNTKSPTWKSQAKHNHDSLIGGMPSVISLQPLKKMLVPCSLDLNISLAVKYRR